MNEVKLQQLEEPTPEVIELWEQPTDRTAFFLSDEPFNWAAWPDSAVEESMPFILASVPNPEIFEDAWDLLEVALAANTEAARAFEASLIA